MWRNWQKKMPSAPFFEFEYKLDFFEGGYFSFGLTQLGFFMTF